MYPDVRAWGDQIMDIKKPRAVDLHVHSTCSDGTFTPRDLVDYAIKKNLSAFALTDHDTVDGLEEAVRYAEALRRRLPSEETCADAVPLKDAAVPEVIPGIELSTEYRTVDGTGRSHGLDVHIVGLFIDYKNPVFTAKLRDFVNSRDNRNRRMCELLQEAGIDVTYEALLAEFPDSVITRAHYAKYMLKRGYVQSMKEAFDRYVGDHCPCFVPREKVTPAQAVQLILEAEGVPVLAHPILYRMSDQRLETLTAELKDVGLMGIEAIYSTYKPYEERQIRALAAKYGLLISGGSDFHGDNKPGLDLGCGYGRLFVPEEVLENLRQKKRTIKKTASGYSP